MAEGIANLKLNKVFKIYSAGVEAHGLNPRAVKVMAEIGIDISHQESNSISEDELCEYNLIITLCGDARDKCLIIDSKLISQIISNKHIKAVSFTGSDIAGSKVAEISGKNIKKTVLELGGSDPFIVFYDADINLAVDDAISAKFLNAGQSCIAPK